jgi:hypothetical protein
LSFLLFLFSDLVQNSFYFFLLIFFYFYFKKNISLKYFDKKFFLSTHPLTFLCKKLINNSTIFMLTKTYFRRHVLLLYPKSCSIASNFIFSSSTQWYWPTYAKCTVTELLKWNRKTSKKTFTRYTSKPYVWISYVLWQKKIACIPFIILHIHNKEKASWTRWTIKKRSLKKEKIVRHNRLEGKTPISSHFEK